MVLHCMASNRAILGVYLRACRPYWALLLSALVFFAIGSLCNTALPAFILRIIVNALSDTSLSREAATAIALRALALLLVTHIIMNITYRLGDITLIRGQSLVLRDVTVLAFSRLRQHSLTFFESTFTGSLVAKSRRFVRSFEIIHDRFVFGLFTLSIHLIASTIALTWAMQWIGGIFLVWCALFITVSFYLMQWRLTTDLEESEEDSRVTGVLADLLTNIRSVQVSGAGTREDAHFCGVATKEWRARLRAWNRHTVIYGVQGVLISLLELPVLYLSIRLWERGSLSIGDIVLMQTILAGGMRHMWELGRTMKDIAKALTNASELVDILEQPLEIAPPTFPRGGVIERGAIHFDNVRFGYTSGRPVLHGLTLHLLPGERVGVVGRSGVGKTTLGKLLLRFIDIQEGSVSIDGVDVRAYAVDLLRRSIGLVPQDPILFHRTIGENIAYGRPEASEKEIIAAAKRAHIHNVIVELQKGYNTLVGERGVKLSGGERQRVLLARVFLQNPPVILLDEPTSALDSESERVVQENLRLLMEGRTTIAIAHRISTIKAMDRIVVIDGGSITEEGTHEGLLAKNGFYARLWSHQINGFLPEETANEDTGKG